MRTQAQRVLAAFTETAWAIEPAKLDAICAFIELRAAGGELSKAEVKALMDDRDRRKVQTNGGVLVLPITGTITQRAGLLTSWSGGTSTEKLGAQIDSALASADVRAIVLDVDSPGGNVAGVPELAEKIYAARGRKPMVAVVNSLMASAAYWLGAAADEIVITPSGIAGSIGVMSVHIEYSRALDEEGITPTILRAGRFKNEANPYEKLPAAAAKRLQAMVDDYYEMFVDAVARFRGVSAADVRNGFGQGDTLTARRSVEAGLVNRIGTLESVLDEFGVSGSDLAAARAQAAEDAVQQLAAAQLELVARPSASAMEIPVGSVAVNAAVSVPSVLLLNAQDDDELDDEAAPEEAPPEGAPLPADPDGGEEETDPDDGGESGAAHETPEPNAAQSAEGETAMSANGTAAPDGAATVEVTHPDKMITAERDRVGAIYALAAEHGMQDKAAEWVESGKSRADVGLEILRARSARGESQPTRIEQRKLVDIPDKERRPYSINRAILSMAEPQSRIDAGYEREVAQEAEKQLRKADTQYSSQGGLLIPTGMGMPIRGGAWDGSPIPEAALYSTTGSAAGEHLVFTERGSFIDALRSRLVLTRMGATFLPGLVGNVGFPKQLTAGTFAWRAEVPGSDANDSDMTTGIVELTPKDGQSTTGFTRRLLAQSTPSAEMMVRNDLLAITQRGIDRAGLHGTGASNQPTGVYSASDVNSEAFNGVPTFAHVVAMESAVLADDADVGVMGYVTTPEVRGLCKTTQMFSSSNGVAVWTGGVENGEMNGYRALASNQILKTLGSGAEHGMIFGVWSELLVGEWGAMELTVDPYSKKKQGTIEVTIHAIVDIALRHGQAFCKATNLQTS